MAAQSGKQGWFTLQPCGSDHPRSRRAREEVLRLVDEMKPRLVVMGAATAPTLALLEGVLHWQPWPGTRHRHDTPARASWRWTRARPRGGVRRLPRDCCRALTVDGP